MNTATATNVIEFLTNDESEVVLDLDYMVVLAPADYEKNLRATGALSTSDEFEVTPRQYFQWEDAAGKGLRGSYHGDMALTGVPAKMLLHTNF